VGQGHEIFRFIAGIPKHDALIAGTDIQITLSDMNATGNIGRLLVDPHKDFTILPIQALAVHAGQVVLEGIKSNFTDLSPDDGFVINLAGRGNFTKAHDHIVLGSRLTGNLGKGIGLQTGIQHGVADLISNLVGMSFIHRFGRKEKLAFFTRGRHFDVDF